jgi:hypothetical protein
LGGGENFYRGTFHRPVLQIQYVASKPLYQRMVVSLKRIMQQQLLQNYNQTALKRISYNIQQYGFVKWKFFSIMHLMDFDIASVGGNNTTFAAPTFFCKFEITNKLL